MTTQTVLPAPGCEAGQATSPEKSGDWLEVQSKARTSWSEVSHVCAVTKKPPALLPGGKEAECGIVNETVPP